MKFLFSFWVPETDKTEVSRLTESSETNLVQNCFKTIWNSSTSLILSLLTSLLASFDVMMVHNYRNSTTIPPAGCQTSSLHPHEGDSWETRALTSLTARTMQIDEYIHNSKRQTKHTLPLNLEVKIH